MPGHRAAQLEQPPGRYGAEYRLALIAAGSAVGILAFIATRTMASWSGLGLFTVLLVSGWSVLLFLHGRAASMRQRRYDGLRRARSFAERLVIYDRETQFYADWYFRLRLQEELVRSQRFDHHCALLLAEATEGRLDHQREAQLFDAMRSVFRGTDLVAHLGSLRFVVLMPNTDRKGAESARKHLLKKLPAGDIEAGLATYPEDGADGRELLAAAGASATDFYGYSDAARDVETSSGRASARGEEVPA